MNNPWGKSGSNMNPYVRMLVCFVTGLVIGTIVGNLPSPFWQIGTAIIFVVTVVFIVHTMWWLKTSKRELDEAYNALFDAAEKRRDEA